MPRKRPRNNRVKAVKTVDDLAADFKRWGLTETRRIKRGVERYGVIFDRFTALTKG